MAAEPYGSRALSHRKWVWSVRVAANDANLVLRFDHLNRGLAAQEIDQRRRIRRRIYAADLELLEFAVVNGQRPPVVPVEFFRDVAQRRLFEHQALLHPGGGDLRIGAGWLCLRMRTHGDLFAGGQNDGLGAGAARFVIGLDPAFDDGHDRGGLLPIDIEFGPHRAHFSISRAYDKGPLAILRHSKQRLTFEQRHAALLTGETYVESRSRIEFDGGSVRELNRALLTDSGGV